MWSRLRVGRRPAGIALSALLLLCAAASPAAAAPPDAAPQGFGVLGVDARTLAVAWDPPADLALATELQFVVPGAPGPPQSRRIPPGEYEWEEETACGRTYVVLARFVNAADEHGPWSSLAEEIPACDPGPPAPPSGLAVSGILGGAFDIDWNPPAENDIARIELDVHAPTDSYSGLDRTLPWRATGVTEEGLICGTSYTIVVTFVTYDGEQSAASTTAATRDCGLLGPSPPAPANLRAADAVATGQPQPATVAWDPWPTPDVARTLVTLMPSGQPARLEYLSGDPSTFRLPFLCRVGIAVQRLLADGRLSASASFPAPPCPISPSSTPLRPATPTPDAVPIALRLPAQKRVIVLGAEGRFALRGATVRCASQGGPCKVRVRTRRTGRRGPGILLGTATTVVPQSRRATLRGRLTPAGAALLRRIGRLRVVVDVAVEQEVGNDYATAHATLVAPKRRSGR